MLLSCLSSQRMPWNLAHSPVQITLFWRLMKGQPLFDKELSE